MTREPAALTIAGSDSSGGAGIQADLKTFAALGVYGASAITALTAQNTTGVQGVQVVPSSFVTQQIESCLSDLDVRAAKTGMLATTDIVAAVAEAMTEAADITLVVDPVMIATSGDPLLSPDAIATYKTRLIPRADLITPNLHEAARLLDAPVARSIDEATEQARALLKLGCKSVLVKGGHAIGSAATDVFADSNGVRLFSAERIPTRNTHGTGCTLSAAITAHLVLGHALQDAIRDAKIYLTEALTSGANRPVGSGHGPVDHLVRTRRARA